MFSHGALNHVMRTYAAVQQFLCNVWTSKIFGNAFCVKLRPGEGNRQKISQVDFGKNTALIPLQITISRRSCCPQMPGVAIQRRSCDAATTDANAFRFARRQGILCQGRGSAANSVVCYCLGMTEVDPTRQPLLFERFISRERKEPPDIDVDFEHERRENAPVHHQRVVGIVPVVGLQLKK